MPPDPKEIRAQVEAALSRGRTNTVLRFVLNILSATPFVGGVFSAAASAWSEWDQDRINRLLLSLQSHTDDKVTEVQGSIVTLTESMHVVAGSITFNPNTSELISASAISSLTDNGTLDFTVNFVRTLEDYVFMCYGSGPVVLESVEQTNGSMRIRFRAPAPDRVTIAFFEQPNPPIQSGRARVLAVNF